MDTLADDASPETIARAAAKLRCRSVAYTYNDPVIFLEYAVDVAAACREAGVATSRSPPARSSPSPRTEFFAAMDAANVDLKAFTEEFYRQQCGGELEPVKETLVYLARETDVWVELTTLLIPGLNDSDRELDEMTAWVVERLGPDVPMHFTAFHPSTTRCSTCRRRRRHPHASAVDRHGQRCPIRLHRQCPRRVRRQHDLPRLLSGAHRPRLVSAHPVEPHRRRMLHHLRNHAARALRRSARRLGRQAEAGAAQRLRGRNLTQEHAAEFRTLRSQLSLLQKSRCYRESETEPGIVTLSERVRRVSRRVRRGFGKT